MSASGLVKRFVARLKASPPWRALRFVYKYPTDPTYRSIVRLSRSASPNLFQPYATTRQDRYPAVFAKAQEQLGDRAGLRILSFGCATGEEVASLRRWFAHAFIKGIDINPRSIEVCRKSFGTTPDVAFAVADSTAGEAAQDYDAIFCMAVLRHGDLGKPGTLSCDHLIRFADFERTIEDFARCLKVGGLLALRHCNFRFCDTASAACFETVLEVALHGKTPQFGRDNRRLPDMPFEGVLFRKRRDARTAGPGAS